MFWKANDNKLDSIDDVRNQLSGCKDLETVYLEGNPLQRSLGPMYRRKIMDALPQVNQIDAT
jgi:protein phosphatase 1 regulatory subunit 7